MTGAGNDFLCLDNTQGAYDELLSSPGLQDVVRHLCSRGTGVGADGVLFANAVPHGRGVDIHARFFEPDGSEAALCGNGTACFASWSIAKGLVAGPEVYILTDAGLAHSKRADNPNGRPLVCLPAPDELRLNISVQANGKLWHMHYINIGVPHAVTFVDDVDAVDVVTWGQRLRHHPDFQPDGVNVDFVQIDAVGEITMRTFEFGVEAETLACGTGSAASAIASCLTYNWPADYKEGRTPAEIKVRGGETLKIWFVLHEDMQVSDVCLETPVHAVYEGTLSAETIRRLQQHTGAAYRT